MKDFEGTGAAEFGTIGRKKAKGKSSEGGKR
jgi:hypothetical protein